MPGAWDVLETLQALASVTLLAEIYRGRDASCAFSHGCLGTAWEGGVWEQLHFTDGEPGLEKPTRGSLERGPRTAQRSSPHPSWGRPWMELSSLGFVSQSLQCREQCLPRCSSRAVI